MQRNALCTYQAWVHEMAAFVKLLAPNHMVTIGSEGFYHSGPGAAVNPGTCVTNVCRDQC